MQRICDFPYVIVFFSALILSFIIAPTIITRDTLVYCLISYSLVTSLLLVIYLMNVILRKGIERRLAALGVSLKGDIK